MLLIRRSRHYRIIDGRLYNKPCGTDSFTYLVVHQTSLYDTLSILHANGHGNGKVPFGYSETLRVAMEDYSGIVPIHVKVMVKICRLCNPASDSGGNASTKPKGLTAGNLLPNSKYASSKSSSDETRSDKRNMGPGLSIQKWDDFVTERICAIKKPTWILVFVRECVFILF